MGYKNTTVFNFFFKVFFLAFSFATRDSSSLISLSHSSAEIVHVSLPQKFVLQIYSEFLNNFDTCFPVLKKLF